jgi:hypothetical protein
MIYKLVSLLFEKWDDEMMKKKEEMKINGE